ncbi:GIDE domain-containing protein [Aquimarina sp. I32.4]|uniref:GIDE domain-containing protein n=1 Tax=Aquimarina sp. I32.4 TaxID=2053903 RepID=UPI000CDEA778|nr:GIDE domain-containing protein [Aquimarina sp. I32.4]
MILYINTTFDVGDIFLFMIIGGMILYGVLKKKKPKPIEILEESKIDSLSKGVVKIKGRLKAIHHIKSPISEIECIGYNYSQLSLRYGRGKKGKKRRKWRILKSTSESTDFYIEDNTGKIKVNAKGISIQINTHRTEKKISRTLLDVENLLIEDETEYIVTGTVITNKNGNLEIVKGATERELVIMDTAFYEFIFEDVPFMKRKMGYFIVFLILAIICFIVYKSFSS